MPIYEYRCESCGNVFDKFVRRRGNDPDECPECSSEEIDRLISNTSFKLKGSGWYETDYARKENGSSSSSGSSSAGASSSDSASESSQDAAGSEGSSGGDDGSSSSTSADSEVA